MTRIMIVGLARSGTTLLQKLIGSFANVHTIPESHYFDYHYQNYDLFGFNYFKQKRYYDPKTLKKNIDDSLVGVKNLHPKTKQEFVAHFLSILDNIATRHGKEIWLEKTPSHLEFIPLIESFTKEVDFIHLIRNPIDNVSSLVRASRLYPDYFKHQDLYKAIKRYRKYLAVSLKHSINKKHHLVKYENLCDDTEKYLTHFQHLFELKKAEISCPENIVQGHEEWKYQSLSNNVEKQTNKFETLTKKEIKLLKDVMQKDMIQYKKIEDGIN